MPELEAFKFCSISVPTCVKIEMVGCQQVSGQGVVACSPGGGIKAKAKPRTRVISSGGATTEDADRQKTFMSSHGHTTFYITTFHIIHCLSTRNTHTSMLREHV